MRALVFANVFVSVGDDVCIMAPAPASPSASSPIFCILRIIGDFFQFLLFLFDSIQVVAFAAAVRSVWLCVV